MNKKTNYSSIQKDNSKTFLRELLLDNRLRTVSGFDEKEDLRLPSSAAMPAKTPFSVDSVAPGQIRLVSQTDFLTYVAILDKWIGNSFLIAPFSRFEQPATDEELKTAYDGGAFMRVLQLWNARSAMVETLKKSWLVGELPEQDRRDALQVWKWSIGDVAELPKSIADRTGVPIYRTDDPRLDYRREALENFVAFDAEDNANAERASRISPKTIWERASKLGFVRRVFTPSSSVRAAAASLETNPRRTFPVDGFPAKLRVEYSRSEKTLIFSVWDKERRIKSDALDGFQVVVEGADEAVPIRNKAARIPIDNPSAEFVLIDDEGQIVGLTEEQ